MAALENWLSAKLPGFAGPLSVEMFKGGQSNPTYKLNTPTRQYVMRAKPGPVAKLLPSAHAIEREFRVMRALGAQGLPVPDVLLLEEDELLDDELLELLEDELLEEFVVVVVVLVVVVVHGVVLSVSVASTTSAAAN
jgi:RIO-like serine/threonine protein kinase